MRDSCHEEKLSASSSSSSELRRRSSSGWRQSLFVSSMYVILLAIPKSTMIKRNSDPLLPGYSKILRRAGSVWATSRLWSSIKLRNSEEYYHGPAKLTSAAARRKSKEGKLTKRSMSSGECLTFLWKSQWMGTEGTNSITWPTTNVPFGSWNYVEGEDQ